MRTIATNAVTQMGKELKEAQDELSNNYRGVFEGWYTALGFKKQTVYNLINRYKLVVQNLDDSNLIESLPKSLIYEVAKPSSDTELKQKVFDGDITTLKEYKELEKAKKEAELKSNQYIEENKQLKQKLEQEQNKEPETIETIVDNTDYETIDKLKSDLEYKSKQYTLAKEKEELLKEQIQNYKEDSQKYKDLKTQIELLTKEKNDIGRQIATGVSLVGYIQEIEVFLQTKLSPIQYSRALLDCGDNPVVIKNVTEIIECVEKWCVETRKYLPANQQNIINVEEYK